MKVETIEQNYAIAKARYAEFGIDTDKAIAELEKTPYITSLLASRRCDRL